MATWWNDYRNNVRQGVSLIPSGARTNGTFNGLGVDMQDAEYGLHADLLTGAVTDGTHDITLEESTDDGATDPYTPINDFITGLPAAFAQLVAADDNVARSLNFKRSKRFVRAVAVGAGATLGAEYSVAIHGMLKAQSGPAVPSS